MCTTYSCICVYFQTDDYPERKPYTPVNDPCPHTPDETPPLSPTGPCTPASPAPSPHTRRRHHTPTSNALQSSKNPECHLPTTHFSEYCDTDTENSFSKPPLSPNKDNSSTLLQPYDTSPSPLTASHLGQDHATSRKDLARKKRRSTETFRHMVSLLLSI